jgi:hypothetical protein
MNHNVHLWRIIKGKEQDSDSKTMAYEVYLKLILTYNTKTSTLTRRHTKEKQNTTDTEIFRGKSKKG